LAKEHVEGSLLMVKSSEKIALARSLMEKIFLKNLFGGYRHPCGTALSHNRYFFFKKLPKIRNGF
jgi:hypothetical protein